MSESPAATSRFIKESCQVEPDTCFTVYGGDGTVHRAVNAVMASGCNKEAMLKIVPIGSGNDFIRSFDDMPDEFSIIFGRSKIFRPEILSPDPLF